MSNSNTPNEQSCRPESAARFDCDCPFCAEAAARAPETATEYCARERAEIIAARRASNDESDRLHAFLKDCDCPCCSARHRLCALSYDRAYGSTSSIHCASTDRRDDNSYSSIDEELSAIDARLVAIDQACLDETNARLEAFARAGRYAENSDKAIRATTERLREDTDTGPARAD